MSEGDARQRIHGSVQSTNDADPALEDSILVSWVLVAEWSAPEGKRWISRLSGWANGEEEAAHWHQQGLLHHALFDWPKEDK